jgi:hypothetical protein
MFPPAISVRHDMMILITPFNWSPGSIRRARASVSIKRIEEGTAPLLFDRDVDLMPVVAEFEDYLEELEQAKREQGEGKKVWRFI